MNRIKDIYYSIKKLFGPSIKVEIIRTNNLEHIFGDHILNAILDREQLTDNELKRIIGEKTTNNIEFLKDTPPIEFFIGALSIEDNTLVNMNQFPDFSRVINFNYQHDRYTIIISTPLFNNLENQNILREFWDVVSRNMELEKDLVYEFIKKDMPVYLRRNFEVVIKTLIEVSMFKIENRPIETGFLFVENYTQFKERFFNDLFLDFHDPKDFRAIFEMKQPLLEVANGQLCFLIVDIDLMVRGLMFPDKIIGGLYPEIEDVKKILNTIVVRISGPDLIRVVNNNRIIFDITNGIIRKRDYVALTETIMNVLGSLGINSDYISDIEKNIVQISTLGKGTILVIGDRLIDNKSNGGIPCEISLLKTDPSRHLEKNQYRNYILKQLSSTDGAVLIDKELNVYKFGTILKVNEEVKTNLVNNGGSRSYAALMFSSENPQHLIVKISEDGPISIYYDGENLLNI